MVFGAFQDRTNLKRYCTASYVGDEPVLSLSEAGGVSAPPSDFVGGRGLRAAAVSRLNASRSLFAVEKDMTLPKRLHRFLLVEGSA
jgi:hypothetical protein